MLLNNEKHGCQLGDMFSGKHGEDEGFLNESAASFIAFAVLSKTK